MLNERACAFCQTWSFLKSALRESPANSKPARSHQRASRQPSPGSLQLQLSVPHPVVISCSYQFLTR
jgi:hypothetical protein